MVDLLPNPVITSATNILALFQNMKPQSVNMATELTENKILFFTLLVYFNLLFF